MSESLKKVITLRMETITSALFYMQNRLHIILTLFCSALLYALTGCRETSPYGKLLMDGCYPYALWHQGKYYCMIQERSTTDIISLTVVDNLSDWPSAKRYTIFKAKEKGLNRIYSPEIHIIKGKWFVYFEADDGKDTDTHQLYVLEAQGADPTSCSYTLHGPIITDRAWNFGLHPSTIVVHGTQYLLWSGWPHRRIEDETQCIYIARMKNPWTLSSPRVLISRPTYEWERQWINPDGSRSAYPIYVNENPQPILSEDSSKVLVFYAASGCWTAFSCVGLIYASSSADLTDPAVWHKRKEPFITTLPEDSICGIEDLCVVRKPGEKSLLLLYDAKQNNHFSERKIWMKKSEYDRKGFPVP